MLRWRHIALSISIFTIGRQVQREDALPPNEEDNGKIITKKKKYVCIEENNRSLRGHTAVDCSENNERDTFRCTFDTIDKYGKEQESAQSYNR